MTVADKWIFGYTREIISLFLSLITDLFPVLLVSDMKNNCWISSGS